MHSPSVEKPDFGNNCLCHPTAPGLSNTLTVLVPLSNNKITCTSPPSTVLKPCHTPPTTVTTWRGEGGLGRRPLFAAAATALAAARLCWRKRGGSVAALAAETMTTTIIKGGGGDGCWRFNLQISTWILLIQIQNSNLSRAEFKSRKIQDLSRDSKALARDLLESSREQPLTLKIIIFLHQQR